ncbi:MAG: molybdenum-pterin-binding protein [Actinobacteria bacterium]|nr:MAG: molybdenum-pterin-binding protein [Actinomycetota bacterium]
MRVSSRNQLPGTVVSIARGPINALVRIEIAEGVTISATLTSEAVDDLGLAVGSPAIALFKATSVLVGVE